MESKEIIRRVLKEFESNSSGFEPFIRHIRFPKYKNFAKNVRIDFNFPITVLVGENGCNKSSIIRALYGAPANKSLGDYWFESKIDTIREEEKAPSCFIYGYIYPLEDKVVEVLKTRVHNKDNPDYWEPSRPIVQYGMEKIEVKKSLTKDEKLYRSKTRWNPVNKDVIYLDFRHEALSAYDKFFYCTDLRGVSDAYKSKQDFVRRYSKNLRKAIDEDLKNYSIYQTKRVVENKLLNDEAVEHISKILNKKYSSIRILTHTFYTSEPAKTVFLSSENGTDYSEAFAGSGEFSVVCLVDAILGAEPKSLILLDEPEVSIHPRAQQKLMEFLCQQVLKSKYQIVIATHSPYITKHLPKGAVKLLFLDKNNQVFVNNNVYPSEVFVEIGASKSQLTILVEDVCAKKVLEACIKNVGKTKLFKVRSAERFGAEGILNHDAVTDFIEGANDIVYCLDGDKRRDFPVIDSNLDKLEEGIKIIAPGAKLTQPNANKETKIREYSRFLEHLQEKLYYLPDAYGPEEIIWEVLPKNEKDRINIASLGKDKFKEGVRQACFNHFGNDDSEAIVRYVEFYAAYLLTGTHLTRFDEGLRKLVDDLSEYFDKIFK